MKVAEKITIDRRRRVVLLDGVEFAYALTEDGPQIQSPCDRNAVPVVTLPVFALDLEVIPEGDVS